jgi:hypothetical protein
LFKITIQFWILDTIVPYINLYIHFTIYYRKMCFRLSNKKIKDPNEMRLLLHCPKRQVVQSLGFWRENKTAKSEVGA